MSRIGEILTNAFRTSPKNIPADSAAAVVVNNGGWMSADKGRVGKPRARQYRHWAEHSEWIRAAIDVRKSQVSQSEWEIVKFDPLGPEPSEALMRRVRRQFIQPSPTINSFRTFIEPIIEDGAAKVLDGLTTVAEVLRVTRVEEDSQ